MAEADGRADSATVKVAAIQAAIAPALQLPIELGAGPADLGAGDFQGAGQLLEDGADFARGNALDIHLGDGQHQGALAAPAALEGRGVKLHLAADLWDSDSHLSQARLEGLGLETIGMAGAGRRALVAVRRRAPASARSPWRG